MDAGNPIGDAVVRYSVYDGVGVILLLCFRTEAPGAIMDLHGKRRPPEGGRSFLGSFTLDRKGETQTRLTDETDALLFARLFHSGRPRW